MWNKIENWVATQQENTLLWVPVFLGLGAALYFSLLFEPPLIIAGAGVFLSSVLFLFVPRLLPNAFLLRCALFVACIIFSGFLLAQFKTQYFGTPILKDETRPLMAEGDISHTEILEGRRGRIIILDNLKLEGFGPQETPKSIRLTTKLHSVINTGDRVRILVKLMPPSMPVMPGAYDFRRHYFFQNIGATGFVLKKPEIITEGNGKHLVIEKIRRKMADHIREVLPVRLSGIVTALITGERAAIEDEDWDALRISGLAHVISISGLHVVMFAAPIFFFVRLFLSMIPYVALHWPIKKIAAFTALIGCVLYVGLVVPTVPTYRALLMTGIGLIAIMLDRSPLSLRLISFAAIAVLVVSPESIWSASFQLSFAAVLSLILSAEWTRAYWSEWRAHAGATRRMLLYLGASIFTTFVVSIMTAPLAAYHFQQIPVYSVIANALIIPLSAILLMPATIATFLLWPIGLEDIALSAMGMGVEWMLAIAHGVSSLPFSVFLLPAWSLTVIILCALAGLSLYLLQGRARITAAVGLLATAIICIFIEPKTDVAISATGGLMMVRMGDDTYLSSSRRERFEAENWLKRQGKKPEDVLFFPSAGRVEAGKDTLTCGQNNCRIEINGRKISFGQDYYALKQDCAWADIIVTPTAFRDRQCRARIFNKFTMKDTGAVTIDGQGNIKTVAESLGIRPWSPKREYKRKEKTAISDRSGSGSTTRPESVRGQP